MHVTRLFFFFLGSVMRKHRVWAVHTGGCSVYLCKETDTGTTLFIVSMEVNGTSVISVLECKTHFSSFSQYSIVVQLVGMQLESWLFNFKIVVSFYFTRSNKKKKKNQKWRPECDTAPSTLDSTKINGLLKIENNFHLQTQAQGKGGELANLKPESSLLTGFQVLYLQSVRLREPSWQLLHNLRNLCNLSEVEYSVYQSQTAAEQSQAAEASAALCRGVSCYM